MMLRFLVKFLLFTIILVVGAVLYSQWKLDKDLQRFARQLSPVVEFDFESARVDYAGEVRINSIKAFIAPLGATLEIGELSFSADNLFQLIRLESNLKNRVLPDRIRVSLKDALVLIDANLLRTLKPRSQAASSDLLQSAFCGEVDQFGIKQIEAMGYNYFSFSGDANYRLDKHSGSIVLTGRLDIEDFSKIDYQLSIGSVLLWLESFEKKIINESDLENMKPELTFIEIKEQDQGYNLRKAEYCSIRQQVPLQDYYPGYVRQVDNLLQQVDIKLTELFKPLLEQAIKPGSNTTWRFAPKPNFRYPGYKYYDYQEFVKLSGFNLRINHSPVEAILDNWNFSRFSKIAEIEAAKKTPPKKPGQLYRSVVVSQSFQSVKPEALDNYLNYQVNIKREGQRSYSGKLTHTTAKNISVLQRSVQGEVTFMIPRSEIESAEVYKETPKK